MPSLQAVNGRMKRCTGNNGVQLDLTDPDKSITSFRGYIIPGLLAAWCREEHHLMAVSFNRNCFEISRNP